MFKKPFKKSLLFVAMGAMTFAFASCEEGGEIKKEEEPTQKEEPTPEVPNYLCFTAVDDAISVGTGEAFPADVEYSVDGGQTWTGVSGLATTQVPLAAGEKMYFRATKLLTKFNSLPSDASKLGNFTTSGAGKLKVSGNIMSLMDPAMQVTDFNATEGQYAFSCLFKDCTNLTDISELSLPAKTLATYCYGAMFFGCTGLTTIPEKLLPATTLAGSCYNSMFYGCTELTTIPEKLLPATTLAEICYNSMFSGCTELITVPKKLLPAQMLAPDCYNNMFHNCSELTTAPELPAKTLVDYCYKEMFSGCSSLTEVTCLATTDLSVTDALFNWLEGTAGGTLYCATSKVGDWGSYLPTGWSASAISND